MGMNDWIIIGSIYVSGIFIIPFLLGFLYPDGDADDTMFPIACMTWPVSFPISICFILIASLHRAGQTYGKGRKKK